MRWPQQLHRNAGIARAPLEDAKFMGGAVVKFLRIRRLANAAQAGEQLQQR
jgi:hypothetical protein